MTFNKTGLATVKLKAGQSATAILPDTFDKVAYDVTEVLSEDQSEDYTATAERNASTTCSLTPPRRNAKSRTARS